MVIGGAVSLVLLQGVAIHDGSFFELTSCEVSIPVFQITLLGDIGVPATGNQGQCSQDDYQGFHASPHAHSNIHRTRWGPVFWVVDQAIDRKSTRLNSS